METRTGETAGEVWKTLSEHGEVSFAKLNKLLSADEKTLLLALGWLLRESKIEISLKGKTWVVSLR